MKTIGYKSLCLSIWLLLVGIVPAFAAHPDTNAEIQNLKQRIQALEVGMPGEGAEEPPFSLFAAGKHLTFSGALELEASYNDTDSADATSDLTLATFELSTEVVINESIGGHVILLYEEDPADDSLKVDEALISLHCPKPLAGQSAAFYGGKMYLPFGQFSSSMVSDPLTLDLGESNNTAALFALEDDVWNVRLGFFNGGVDAAGDNDHIDSLVAALDVHPLENLTFGLSWISDLAESGAELVADPALYGSSVAGASAFVSLTFGAVGFEAEIVGALDDFDAALVGASDLTGQKPMAWNLEANWALMESLQLTARYEKANDFQDDMARYGVAGSYGLFTNTVLAFEFLHAAPDTGPDSDTVTAQLAFEF